MDIIVSFPRSGQHLVEKILEFCCKEHDIDFTYCEFYTCCESLPCKEEVIWIPSAFTPNGDGTNEWFQIDNIEQPCHLPNTVEIYNRWGVLVYETKNYDNNTRRFEGVSEGRTTVNKSSELPTGTYFYIIQWTDGTQKVNKDGYLYLTR